MSEKIEELENWRKVVLPNSQIGFSTVSPVKSINGPFFAYAWAGVGSMASGATIPWGTVVGVRIDNDPLPLNINYWLLNSTGTISLLRVDNVRDKSKIPEHWVQGIPTIFQEAPSTIKELILNKQSEAVSNHGTQTY